MKIVDRVSVKELIDSSADEDCFNLLVGLESMCMSAERTSDAVSCVWDGVGRPVFDQVTLQVLGGVNGKVLAEGKRCTR
jgi:hypothetical protein